MASFKTGPFTMLPHESLEEYGQAVETERLRAEEAERMYETLKKIHEDCTEEFRITQNQTHTLLTELEQRMQKADDTVKELRGTIVEQSRELSEIRPQLLTPQKQQVLRLSVQAEFDKQYQAKLRLLQEEVVNLKSKVAGLTYENSSLQADLAARENDFKRIKSDLIQKYERKLDERDREKDVASIATPAVDMGRFRQLQRDNDHLEVRVKAQQSELDLVHQAEKRRIDEAHTVHKAQTQKLSELTVKVENLKTELDIEKRHNEGTRSRISELTQENTQLSQKKSTQDEELRSAEMEREGLVREHQTALVNERAKLIIENTVARKLADALSVEVEKLKAEIDLARQAVELQRGSVAAKEHESQTKLNQLMQQHVTELATAEQEKHVLEAKISNAEKLLTDMKAAAQDNDDKHIEKVRHTDHLIQGLHGDLTALKDEIERHKNVQISFQGLTKEHAALQHEVQSLLGKISGMEYTFQALEKEKTDLEVEISRLKNQHHDQELRLGQIQMENETRVSSLQQNWIEKRNSYALYVRKQSHELQQIKKRRQGLIQNQATRNGKNKEFRRKAASVVAELVRAVHAKSALLDLAKDAVTSSAYKKVVDELSRLKDKMGRLKTIAVPRDGTDFIAQHPSQDLIMTTKSISEQFDRVTIGSKISKHPEMSPSIENDLQRIYKRLKEIGLLEPIDDEDTDEMSSDLDGDSIAIESDDAPSVLHGN